MSNVLIGIIGVILFIGLALAGALILGDDFRTASNSTQATTIVSQMKQVADAIEMYRLKTGRPIREGQEEDLVPRFLKTYPYHPVSIAPRTARHYRLQIQINDRIFDDIAPDPTLLANYLTLLIADGTTNISTAKSRDICQAIAEQTGSGVMGTTGHSGCFNFGSSYVAYIKL